MKYDEIQCVQVHDIKEAVYELIANDKLACYVTQATGAKASPFFCCLEQTENLALASPY